MFSFFKEAFGLVSVSPWKLALITALVASITGFVVWYDNARYQAGWNAHIVASMEKNKEAREKAVGDAVAKVKADLSNALSESEKRRQEALKLIEQLRQVPETPKPEIVTRIITESDCSNLGNDVKDLFNSYIGEKP